MGGRDEGAETERASWAPAEIPADRPSVARMYDYFLGGAHNFAIDRQAAERVMSFYPEIRRWAQSNRAFLRRAVRYLIDQGVEQFLDIGSGIPTVGNVHEAAQGLNPAARVVYVDIDPVAVAHAQAMLRDNPQAIAVRADGRDAVALLEQPEFRALLDPAKPLGVILAAVLHFLPDDAEAYGLTRALTAALPAGSYLVISHVTADELPASLREQFVRLYANTSSPGGPRSRADIERFFAGLELVEPGVVWAPLWRPETATDLYLDHPEQSSSFVGVGRKA